MIVDAHHHIWDPTRADYPWLTDELAVIRRAFTPDDLRPALAAAGVDASVLVQTRSSVEETAEFLATAAVTPFIAGVVGWVDLTDAGVGDTLTMLHEGPGGRRLVGIRHQVHDEPDPDWLRRDHVGRGLDAVETAGLVFDLLVRTRELPSAIFVARRHPGLQFVLDHLAKPPIRSGELEPWSTLIGELASLPNVTAKLSGLVTEADWTAWDARTISPYARRALETFGPERLMFGSDWPVCLLAASYQDVIDVARTLLAALGPEETADVFGGTAERVYRLGRSVNQLRRDARRCDRRAASDRPGDQPASADRRSGRGRARRSPSL